MRAIFEPYRMTWHFLRAAPLYVLVMALILLGISVVSDYFDTGLSITFVPYLCIFFAMLRAMTFGETTMLGRPAHPVRPQSLGWFLNTGTVLFGILIVFALLLFLIIDGATGFQSTAETRTGPLFLTLLVSSCCVAAAFGTMLPAKAAADDTDFATRVLNAVKSGPAVFVGMLFGPCLCMIALLIAVGLLGVAEDGLPYQDASGAIDPIAILFAIPFAVLRISVGFLSCAVLIRAYRTRAPKEITDVMV